jgi:hypothetical protein
MQLISFIDFAELELLNDGYTMTDQLASTVKDYLALLKIEYLSPFACIGVLPDNAPVSESHPLRVFGDTQLDVPKSVVKDLRLSCESDIQTTAKNALARWKQDHKLQPRPTVIDLKDTQLATKLAHVERLALEWSNLNYPEVRIHRGLTWSDIDDRCAEKLKAKPLDFDGILGPNRR